MNVAVVIVTYNRLNLLKECIYNALNQNNIYTELVIVNNKSNDGTYEYLETLSDDRIHCIHEQNNIGGAGGFHDGLEYAYKYTQCEWFLLIDDDAIIDNNYIKEIQSKMTTDYEAYAGTVYVNNEIDIRHRTRKDNGTVAIEEYDKPFFKCDIATFCGLLVSRKLVKEIGYPRREFFIWEDDTEYCYRFMNISSILVVTSAILNHKTYNPNYKIGDTIKDDWKWYYGFRNQLVMYKTYEKKKYIIKILKLYTRAIQYKIKALTSKKQHEEYLYNSELRFDAIRDASKEKMGRNAKY